LNITRLDIYGSLVLGSANSDSFTFQFPPVITVYRDGSIQDATAKNQIYSPEDTLMNIYPGGRFIGQNTTIITYNPTRATQRAERGLDIGSPFSGPFTCGILPGDLVQFYYRITFMVRKSGEFLLATTWLGGVAPSHALCTLAGGCGLSITAGYTVTTVSLNGRLAMLFVSISISIQGLLVLNSPASPPGFQFLYPMDFGCSGGLRYDGAPGGSIFMPPGSNFNLFPSAQFTSISTVSLTIFDPLTNVIISVSTTLSATFVGPYYVAVSVTGITSISIISEQPAFLL
jgi:hypothetical protein